MLNIRKFFSVSWGGRPARRRGVYAPGEANVNAERGDGVIGVASARRRVDVPPPSNPSCRPHGSRHARTSGVSRCTRYSSRSPSHASRLLDTPRGLARRGHAPNRRRHGATQRKRPLRGPILILRNRRATRRARHQHVRSCANVRGARSLRVAPGCTSPRRGRRAEQRDPVPASTRPPHAAVRGVAAPSTWRNPSTASASTCTSTSVGHHPRRRAPRARRIGRRSAV
jgi:hypothetical protein